MTMENFIEMLEGIRDNKEVLIPYNLHCDGQLHRIIDAFGGAGPTAEYFKEILDTDPATIGSIKP